MGDFNIDVLDVNNPITKRFDDLLKSFGLVWSVNSPTRVTDHSATAIDNVVTNVTDAKVTVINTAISDHYGQQVTISGQEPKRDPQNKKTIRDTRPANISLLNFLLSQEKWNCLNLYDPIEQQFMNFEQTFSYHLDVSCPLKKTQIKPRNQKCTWITKGILISRDKLLFTPKLKSTQQIWNSKTFSKTTKESTEKSLKLQKLMR